MINVAGEVNTINSTIQGPAHYDPHDFAKGRQNCVHWSLVDEWSTIRHQFYPAEMERRLRSGLIPLLSLVFVPFTISEKLLRLMFTCEGVICIMTGCGEPTKIVWRISMEFWKIPSGGKEWICCDEYPNNYPFNTYHAIVKEPQGGLVGEVRYTGYPWECPLEIEICGWKLLHLWVGD